MEMEDFAKLVNFATIQIALLESRDKYGIYTFNEKGRARMVDVSEKNETQRKAIARGYIQMNPETIKLVVEGKMKKEMFFQ